MNIINDNLDNCPIETAICPVDGTQFRPFPSWWQQTKVYCSRRCEHTASRRRQRARARVRKQVMAALQRPVISRGYQWLDQQTIIWETVFVGGPIPGHRWIEVRQQPPAN